MAYEKGDIVFNEHGQRFVYVAESDGDHIVRPTVETDEEEQWEGNPVTLRKIFASAPRDVYDKTIQALDMKVSELQEKRRALEEELRKSKQDETERKKRIMTNAALERIDDFLAGKITHFVYGEYGVEIKTFEESTSDPDRRERDVKLLSLYGRSKGDLAWKLNDYYDGSGSWRHVYPCSSLEDATNLAKRLIETKYEEWRKDGKNSYWLTSVVASSVKFGIPIPKDVRTEIKNQFIKTASQHREQKHKEFLEAEDRMRNAINNSVEELVKGNK
jgi:FtsZ-binding cell division protein ZapB